MKIKAGVTECPHCKGLSGFRTRVIFDCFRFTQWDGECNDTDDYKLVSETGPVCMDCGKPVRSVVGH